MYEKLIVRSRVFGALQSASFSLHGINRNHAITHSTRHQTKREVEGRRQGGWTRGVSFVIVMRLTLRGIGPRSGH